MAAIKAAVLKASDQGLDDGFDWAQRVTVAAMEQLLADPLGADEGLVNAVGRAALCARWGLDTSDSAGWLMCCGAYNGGFWAGVTQCLETIRAAQEVES